MVVVKGCHLVGSVPAPDAETVFKDALDLMPGRLKRLPDGETGERDYFTLWQTKCFAPYPLSLIDLTWNNFHGHKEFSQADIDEGVRVLESTPMQTGYDTAAVESYEVFKRLRDQDIIPKGVKFLVTVPGVGSVMPVVHAAFRPAFAPIWTQAMKRAIINIQDSIPHDDLSIQIDLSVETALWEGVLIEPWFSEDPKKYSVAYILDMITWIDQDVELGIHNCYGDMEHKHWMEPKSLQTIVDRGLAFLEGTSHPIQYFHCPIPLSATEYLEDYVKPIVPLYEKLKAQGGELIFGLVHHNDLEGNKKRIQIAGQYVPEFSIATECGMGRTPKEQIRGIYEQSAQLSQVY